MNTENLKPIRTKSEARAKGKKGGIKSGESRRNKRAIKDALLFALSLPLTEDEANELRAVGVTENDLTQVTAIAIGVIAKAKQGDLKATEYLRKMATSDTLGLDFTIEDEF